MSLQQDFSWPAMFSIPSLYKKFIQPHMIPIQIDEDQVKRRELIKSTASSAAWS